MTDVLEAAEDVLRRGFQPVPLHPGSKKPIGSSWQSTDYTADDLTAFRGDLNLGVRLGVGGLVEVDLDDPYAVKAAKYLLPATHAVSGRSGAPRSHWWYLVDDPPRTTQWKTSKEPVGETLIELRGLGGQTVIPPSVHPSGESYEWHGRVFGGMPSGCSQKDLTACVHMVAMMARLAGAWPGQGGRHGAYLALAGALMNDSGRLDAAWSVNLSSVFVRALAQTIDDEEWNYRARETVLTTARRLEEGQTTQGWPTLANIVGEHVVADVRKWEGEYRKTIGVAPRKSLEDWSTTTFEIVDGREPKDDEVSSWAPVDLAALADAGYVRPTPTIALRSDGQGLFYPGRLNMLVGPSRSGKTWLAMQAALQLCAMGETVVYVDMEDSAELFLSRMTDLGLTVGDVPGLTYINPVEQIAALQVNRWGVPTPTDDGAIALADFLKTVRRTSPSMIVIDGFTVLLSLHGLNANDASHVEMAGRWFRGMSAGSSRPAVLVIDHNGKNPVRGGEPHGSQHKTSMVSGSLLQTWEISQIKPGALGRAEVLVIKDRPGGVLQHSEPDADKVEVAARLVVDSTWSRSENTLLGVLPPDGDWGEVPRTVTIDLSGLSEKAPTGSVGPGALEKEVLGTLAGGGGKTFDEMMSVVPHTTDTELRQVLAGLEVSGRVMRETAVDSVTWSLIPAM